MRRKIIKILEFYTIFARKIFFHELWGHFPSPMPMAKAESELRYSLIIMIYYYYYLRQDLFNHSSLLVHSVVTFVTFVVVSLKVTYTSPFGTYWAFVPNDTVLMTPCSLLRCQNQLINVQGYDEIEDPLSPTVHLGLIQVINCLILNCSMIR